MSLTPLLLLLVVVVTVANGLLCVKAIYTLLLVINVQYLPWLILWFVDNLWFGDLRAE